MKISSSLGPLNLFILYLLLLVTYGIWLAHGLPFHIDTLVYDYPERSLNLQNLQEGWIPLWNPYISCGIPHLANWQSAVFYPPYWLLRFTGVQQGLVWIALLHCAWAYAGFYLWARSQKVSTWVSALGALSFAGSAHLTLCWVNLHFISTAIWIPWAFYSIHLVLREKQWRWMLAAAGVISFQLLAGYPLFVFYTWLSLTVWLAFQKIHFQDWVRIKLVFVIALAFTSFQWLPFLEFLTYAKRGGWDLYPYYTHGREFLTLLQPRLLGFPGSNSYQANPANSIYGDLYFGLIPLMLWAASLIWKRKGFSLWGWSALAGLAWLAGPYFPLLGFVPAKALELLEPSKAVSVFLFTACTAACLSADGFVSGFKKSPLIRMGLGLAALLWVVDMGRLPFELVLKTPDYFGDATIGQNAQKLRQWAEDKRMLAIQSPDRLTAGGGKLKDVLGGELLGSCVKNFLPNTNAVWGIRSPSSYLSLYTDSSLNLDKYAAKGFPFLGDLLDIAGVRLFLLPQSLPRSKFKDLGFWAGNTLSLNPRASEDMRWVPMASGYPSRPEILNILAKPNSGWEKKVYLEKNNDGTSVQLEPVNRAGIFPAVKDYQRPCASRASVGVPECNNGFLVFNESFAPGWHAWVDGKPTPILRAYGLFMAVQVMNGSQQVDFRFEPVSFRLGFFITLATYFVLLSSLGIRNFLND